MPTPMEKIMIEQNGFATKLLDPTEKEAIMLNNQAVEFMKNLERNPQMAKSQFKNIILPHMMRALRTTRVLDEHLEATALEVKKLLKANVILIELLKRNGIDMPNFSEIENDVIRDHLAEYGGNTLGIKF
jgi:hypothetical protein